MENLAENHLMKFKNLSKKKGIVFANFSVKSIRGGVVISTSISVDISLLELHQHDSLDKIIEESAKKALKEFKKSSFQLEGFSLSSQSDCLGVAQLG